MRDSEIIRRDNILQRQIDNLKNAHNFVTNDYGLSKVRQRALENLIFRIPIIRKLFITEKKIEEEMKRIIETENKLRKEREERAKKEYEKLKKESRK